MGAEPGVRCSPARRRLPTQLPALDASQGGLMTRGLSSGLFPGLTLWPSGLHPFKSNVLLCVRCLFRVRVILRGHVAVCPVSSLLGTHSVIWSVPVPVGGMALLLVVDVGSSPPACGHTVEPL